MFLETLTFFILNWISKDVVAQFSIVQSGLEIEYNVTDYNYCLVNEFRLQAYVGRHFDDCITACALRTHCKALTYRQHGSASICELFQTADRVNATHAGCVYIQRKDLYIKKIPCTNGCTYGKTCDVVAKSCQYTECVSSINITDGQIIGNVQAVGNKVQFLCNGGISQEKRAVCQTNGEWSVSSVTCIRPKDCKELLDIGVNQSDVYRIFPAGTNSSGIYVACDMDTPPGGWTIIQRRIDFTDFYRTWNEYKIGFSDKHGSFWLGNENIWELIRDNPYQLRIDLTAQDSKTGYAICSTFSIENEKLQYELNISGFRSNVGDSLTIHNRMKFTTKDRDNDKLHDNCARLYGGGWWYRSCHASNLNGFYMNNEYGKGLNWKSWRGFKESLKSSEMKIRPV